MGPDMPQESPRNNQKLSRKEMKLLMIFQFYYTVHIVTCEGGVNGVIMANPQGSTQNVVASCYATAQPRTIPNQPNRNHTKNTPRSCYDCPRILPRLSYGSLKISPMQYAIDVRPLSELTFITDFTSDFTSVCPSHIKYPVYPCAFKSLSVATFRTFKQLVSSTGSR